MIVESIIVDRKLEAQKYLWAQAHTVEMAQTLLAYGMPDDTPVVVDIEGMLWPAPRGVDSFILASVAQWGDE